jgi:hypothetical protein
MLIGLYCWMLCGLIPLIEDFTINWKTIQSRKPEVIIAVPFAVMYYAVAGPITLVIRCIRKPRRITL